MNKRAEAYRKTMLVKLRRFGEIADILNAARTVSASEPDGADIDGAISVLTEELEWLSADIAEDWQSDIDLVPLPEAEVEEASAPAQEKPSLQVLPGGVSSTRASPDSDLRVVPAERAGEVPSNAELRAVAAHLVAGAAFIPACVSAEVSLKKVLPWICAAHDPHDDLARAVLFEMVALNAIKAERDLIAAMQKAGPLPERFRIALVAIPVEDDKQANGEVLQ